MSAIQTVQNRSQADIAAAAGMAAQAPHAPNPEPRAQAPAEDTVQISSAAKAALVQSRSTPAQEAAETPAQTAKEAAGGDVQAKAKLAREEAAQRG